MLQVERDPKRIFSPTIFQNNIHYMNFSERQLIIVWCLWKLNFWTKKLVKMLPYWKLFSKDEDKELQVIHYKVSSRKHIIKSFFFILKSIVLFTPSFMVLFSVLLWTSSIGLMTWWINDESQVSFIFTLVPRGPGSSQHSEFYWGNIYQMKSSSRKVLGNCFWQGTKPSEGYKWFRNHQQRVVVRTLQWCVDKAIMAPNCCL